MQNGSLNGTSQPHDNITSEPEGRLQGSIGSGVSSDLSVGELIPSNAKEDDVANNHQQGPPSKKRKLADSNTSERSVLRPISPPWKRVAFDGPTSFIEGG